MADNYLENKMEAHRAMASSTTKKKIVNESLDNLVLKNRSYRAFKQDSPVSYEDFRKMVALCTKIPSARNRQGLRFRFVSGEEAQRLTPVMFFGGYAANETGPHDGKNPPAYIIIYSIHPEGRQSGWVDVGIAAQTILLKATEMGYGGVMMMAFVPEKVARALDGEVPGPDGQPVPAFPVDKVTGQPLHPVLVIALGKPDEKVQLLGLDSFSGDAPMDKTRLHYFRKEGIHYVPKLNIDDLIL